MAQGTELETSVLATLVLKRIGVPWVVAKATTELRGEVLLRVGADRVIFPERDAGIRLAHTLGVPRIDDYISLSPSSGVAKFAAPPNLAGRTLADVHAICGAKLSTLAIKRGRNLITTPSLSERIQPGDEVVVAGPDDEIEAFVEAGLVSLGRERFRSGTPAQGRCPAAARSPANGHRAAGPARAAGIPHPGRHAQTFAVALGCLILGGAALLASPWASESGDPTPSSTPCSPRSRPRAVTGLVTVDTATHWNRLGEAVILVLIQAGGLGFMVGADLVLQALRRGTTRLSDVLLIKEGAPTLSLREAAVLSRRIVVFTFAAEAVGAAVLALRFQPGHAAARGDLVRDLQRGLGVLQRRLRLARSRTGDRSSSTAPSCSSSRRGRCRTSSSRTSRSAAGGRGSRSTASSSCSSTGAAGWRARPSSSSPSGSGRWRRSRRRPARWRRCSRASPPGRPGFATVDFADVHHVTLFLWVAVMLVGGASGSTAGGVKLATVGVVVAAVLSTLRGQEETQVFGRRVPTPLVFRAMAVIAVMLAVHFLATAALAATEGLIGGQEFGFIALMFETMSALATVGLSTGITPDLDRRGQARPLRDDVLRPARTADGRLRPPAPAAANSLPLRAVGGAYRVAIRARDLRRSSQAELIKDFWERAEKGHAISPAARANLGP